MTKEERKEYNKRYQESYQQSPKYKESIKKYQQSPKYKDAQRAYQRNRKATDPAFKFLANLRSRHSEVLRGKVSTTAGLGCTTEQLREYLQTQWSIGMSWDNYGHGPDKWTIDHRLPLDSYERSLTGEWDITSEYNQQLIHYTNLQPMWFLDNMTKGAKL